MAPQQVVCSQCGRSVPQRGGFCPVCGNSLNVGSTTTPAADPLEGTILDQKYRLIKKIGEGGMAKIYAAEHVFLREQRAIKLIKKVDPRRATQLRRFSREARLARKVSAQTTHVVRIDDFGFHQGIGYYYSMEMLDGRSLRDLLREPPYYLNPDRVIHIAKQVCDAMATAHREGMVHRDLKPDNVYLIEAEGDPFYVKLLDFGLAKPLYSDETDYTDMGKVVGTPEYMSPEQCRGPTPEERAQGISHLDGRSDIYSLGIVMYQCLIGRVPFSLEGEPNPQNLLNLMTRQISERVIPLRQIRKDVSPSLEQAIDKALQKRPERRFQSMEEFREALLAIDKAHATLTPSATDHVNAEVLALADVVDSREVSALQEDDYLEFELQLDHELDDF